MKRTYTLFTATKELLRNRAILLLARSKTFQLILGTQDTITIAIRTQDAARYDLARTSIIYEDHIVTLYRAHTYHDRHHIYVSLTLETRELGLSRLAVVIPEVTTYQTALSRQAGVIR